MTDTSNFIKYIQTHTPNRHSHLIPITTLQLLEHMESKLVLSSKDLATVDLQYMYFLQCI